MMFALCLQVLNHLHFNQFADLYYSFIPQTLFLQSIFGYLVIYIIYRGQGRLLPTQTLPIPQAQV